MIRASTSISVPEEKERIFTCVEILVMLVRSIYLFDGAIRIIAQDGSNVGEQLRPVQTDPVESGERKLISTVSGLRGTTYSLFQLTLWVK